MEPAFSRFDSIQAQMFNLRRSGIHDASGVAAKF
jgi:hypothetical protein